MSHLPPPIPITLLSDDEDEITNSPFKTPTNPNPLKRPRPPFQTKTIPNLIIDVDDDDDIEDPTPFKLRKSPSLSSSPLPSVVPETPLTDLTNPKPNLNPPIIRCSLNIPRSPPNLSDDGGLICLESDDEAEGGFGRRNMLDNTRTYIHYEGEDYRTSPRFHLKSNQMENEKIGGEFETEFRCNKSPGIIDWTCDDDKVGKSNSADDEAEGGLRKTSWLTNTASFSGSDAERDLDKSTSIVDKENHCRIGVGRLGADSDVEFLQRSPYIIESESPLCDPISSNRYNSLYSQDDSSQALSFQDNEHDKENIRLEEEHTDGKPKRRGKGKIQRNLNKDEQAANKKKLAEEKLRLKEEKRRNKEQEKLEKEKSKQLDKAKQKWEKEAETYIVANINPKVLEDGAVGGQLLQAFTKLKCNLTSNQVENTIFWRFAVPEELEQLSLEREIPYVLLIFGAEEFCQVATDGSLMDRISSLRTRYPSYTICCLTNKLSSYIHKRDQEKYKKQRNASDWKRPPVEEVFAKLAIHFTNVHSRQCADEAELADHVVGLTKSLAKCHFRKKLSLLSVNANGGHIPKDCLDRELIMKTTWLKMLISIPKVQPRFAVAIFKKYPTMKSLLTVYMKQDVPVLEKEFLLQDLMTEGISGNEDRRVGGVCSKRVYRVLMAQNGSLTTDEAESGADSFKLKDKSC